MAIDFPSSPANGQIYVDSTSGYSFTYYTTPGAWKSTGASIPAQDRQYTWTNTQTFSNVITFNANLLATSVNSVTYTIGGSFVANSTGMYHTGIANAASFRSGNSTVNSYMNATTVSGLFYENANAVTANYTITTGFNASSTGPITINTGITVTVPSGQVWAIR
jgi:hypothetical protein